MPKRSPWESYHRRQQQIDRKVFDLMQSTAHMCLCGHAQGFHWDTDDGDNVGRCVDADCLCGTFDEDVLFHARLRAELSQGGTAKRSEPGDDALARAMRDEEGRDVSDDETWDRVLHADRSRPTGKPRSSALQSPAILRALREIGGSPDDLTG